jgi:sugar lactone lactonase YvrE
MTIAWVRSRAALPYWLAACALTILALVVTTANTAAVQPGAGPFQRTWSRTDWPVADGQVPRTWMWGPQANSEVALEPYSDAPGGSRSVQYFDKARMEDNGYRADGPPWDVTNGLLVVEMITGSLQTGDAAFEQRTPAQINVAGDADDATGPTYATFGTLLDAAPRGLGSTITERVDREANVSDDPSLAGQGVTVGHIDEVTNHAIAGPFWDFMNSSGTVYEDGQFVDDLLFENAYFATGRPITEAYWANVKVAGQYRDVLMQCFERRCLTYTPGNPDGFVVEAGNVGQHYYQWRYGQSGEQPTPTATSTATATPTATMTPEPSPTATTPPEPATEYEFSNKWGSQRLNISLSEPNAVAVAPNGDVYVTNTATNQILRFAPNGQLITAWGSEGTNTGQFKTPTGIDVDGQGNVYVADYNNHRIQKFDPNGAFITTWGKEGVGQGDFKFPYDVTAGPDGTVYVSDLGNNRVQRFWGSGQFVKTWGGLGTGPGQFVTPHGIDINGSLVYVADAGNQRVQVFNVDGEHQGSFGQGGDGPGQFTLPLRLKVAANGAVFVSDIGSDRVQIFTMPLVVAPEGTRALAAVQYEYAGAVGEPGEFNNPLGLALDQNGRLLVADASNNAIKIFAGNSITLQPGDYELVDTWLDDTRGRFLLMGEMAQGKDGRMYVVDWYEISLSSVKAQIQVFSASGEYLDQIRDLVPSGLAFDSAGNLFTYNLMNRRIEKFSPDGEFIEGWGPANPQTGIEESWKQLAIDADDNLYIVNIREGTIHKYSADGVYLDAWGAPGSQPGQLDYPSGIAIYGERVYVADSGNNRVQVFDLNGAFILEWGNQGTGDGQFFDEGMRGIAVDSHGYVYVADGELDRIQKFTPEGEFLTKWGSEGIGDGAFLSPGAVVVDPSGDVYVVDYYNYRIQVFRPVS